MAKLPCNADAKKGDNIDSTSWSDLPLDVVGTILSKLPTAGDVVRATSVCKRFLEAFPVIQSLSINISQEASSVQLDDVDVCRLVLGTNRLRALQVLGIGCRFPASGILGLLRHLRPALKSLEWGPEHEARTADTQDPSGSEADSELFLHEISSMERLEELQVYSLSFSSKLSFKASGFKSLRCLGLTNVLLQAASVGVLLTSAKTLEALQMTNCVFRGLRRDAFLFISSDSLKSLTIWMSEFVANIQIDDETAAKLEILKLGLPYEDAFAREHSDVWIFLGGPLPKLRSITLCEGAAVSARTANIMEGASGLEHLTIGSRTGLYQLSKGLLKLTEQRYPSLVSLELDSDTLNSFFSDPEASFDLKRLKKLVLWVPVKENGTVNPDLHETLLKILKACAELRSLDVYVWDANDRHFRFKDFSRFLFQLQRCFSRVAISQFVEKDYYLGRRQL